MPRPPADQSLHISTRPVLVALLFVLMVASARPAHAHPVPFSYLDVVVHPDRIEGSLVAHVIDIAHDLSVDPPSALFSEDADRLRPRIAALIAPRLTFAIDGREIAPSWTGLTPMADRDSLRMPFVIALSRPPGVVTVRCALFPYDPNHQTFLNVYDARQLVHQSIFDRTRASFDFYPGTRQGSIAVVRRFVPEGVRHILIGPDHILFLIGLLLLGGALRQLVFIVSAFTLAHSVTLTLAALSIVSPPPRIVEPAIALSIVYVGADNLLVKGGRDMRAWIALSFGLIHGFGFASVLREMDLPSRALGWSLFAFNLGVEIGQVVIVLVVASVLAALRGRSAVLGRRIAVAGSVAVICAGVFWFIQRVFFVNS